MHDTANILAGIQGILELGDRGGALGDRDHQRLEAVLAEGFANLTRTRHLALETLPDSGLQEGPDWRAELASELQPMGILFKCRFGIALGPGPAPDLWPGLLRSYLRAVVRQVLPYCQGGTMEITCRVEAARWQVRLHPVSLLPESLLETPQDRPGDIGSRWAVRLAETLKITLSCEDGSLVLQVPRT